MPRIWPGGLRLLIIERYIASTRHPSSVDLLPQILTRPFLTFDSDELGKAGH
jgi:hypothetical protein